MSDTKTKPSSRPQTKCGFRPRPINAHGIKEACDEFFRRRGIRKHAFNEHPDDLRKEQP